MVVVIAVWRMVACPGRVSRETVPRPSRFYPMIILELWRTWVWTKSRQGELPSHAWRRTMLVHILARALGLMPTHPARALTAVRGGICNNNEQYQAK